MGAEVFDTVPDRFKIRELIALEQEIHEKLNKI
jgi:hypothetical protein